MAVNKTKTSVVRQMAKNLGLKVINLKVVRMKPEDLKADKTKTAYGKWCRNPQACTGKGYCPLDPTCGD